MTVRHVNSQFDFKLHSRCRKHLVFVDSHRVTDVVPDVERMLETGYPVEWNYIGTSGEGSDDQRIDKLIAVKQSWPDVGDTDALRTYLENQPIGTHLYIATAWASARGLMRIAEAAGYAKEDIQVRGYGHKYEQVFCISCYTMNPIDSASTVTCRQCGKLLSVTDHYSRRLDAVMGYLILDNSVKKGNL
jgi:hypothetical protein